jgi:hypothetical protein
MESINASSYSKTRLDERCVVGKLASASIIPWLSKVDANSSGSADGICAADYSDFARVITGYATLIDCGEFQLSRRIGSCMMK